MCARNSVALALAWLRANESMTRLSPQGKGARTAMAMAAAEWLMGRPTRRSPDPYTQAVLSILYWRGAAQAVCGVDLGGE